MHDNILSVLAQDQVKPDPFPHIVVRNALEPALYAELEASFPSFDKIRRERKLQNNTAYLLSAVEVLDDPDIPEIWRSFFARYTSEAFFRGLLEFWKPQLAQEYPNLEQQFGKPLQALTTGLRPAKATASAAENQAADAMLDVQFGVNSVARENSTVRGPHIDKPVKLFAGLLYFRHPEDQAEGGNLELYRYRRDRRHFDKHFNINDRFLERVTTVPYEANTLVMWLNTPRSLHGVSHRSSSSHPRRYVNFITECYRLPEGGFFSLPKSPLQSAVDLVGRRLSGAVA